MSAAKAMLEKTIAAERKERRNKKRTMKTITADDSARPRRSVSWARTASLSSSSRITFAPPGSRASTCAIRALASSATWTTLVPISLTTWKLTAGCPSMR
jgi:hypothetical protein